ncbi:hypothetical protein FB451DRAFT_1247525 [Mycena latifolia]|nr:hypothetical protein FB451DRAFT_1247525 [Mycena latifolia]
MDWVLESAIDTLPDDVLAVILKLAADTPAPAWAVPFPLVASRVSRRWCTLARGCPELWTTICISHRSRSWIWAALFVKRSQSRLLDICINLESYVYETRRHCISDRKRPHHPAYISMDRALAIVGPHVGRWRTIAVRGWDRQLRDFFDFLRSAPGAASRVESAHFCSLDYYGQSLPVLPELPALVGLSNLRFLRANAAWCREAVLRRIGTVQHLDIELQAFSDFDPHHLRQIFGPASNITTLVIREFYPRLVSSWDPIDASTVRSFAVGFSTPFYYDYRYYGGTLGGLETITDAFVMPNLEHLEIIGGFTGVPAEDVHIHVPAEWEAPLFPSLRTLRLEDVGFSRAGLALIQSLSRGITSLELIHTTGNHHLLSMCEQWPTLHTLTVETLEEGEEPDWLAPFLATRAALGENMRILELTLMPPLDDHSLALQPAPVVRWLAGPSPALIDGVSGHGFCMDEVDGRAVDFEHIEDWECRCGCEYRDCDCDSFYERDWYHGWRWDGDLERLLADIAEEFKMAGELVRSKGMWREARKQRRREFKAERVGRQLKVGLRAFKHRPYDLRPDFWVT